MKPDPASQIFNAIVPAPFGALGIRTADDKLREVVYLPPSFAENSAKKQYLLLFSGASCPDVSIFLDCFLSF